MISETSNSYCAASSSDSDFDEFVVSIASVRRMIDIAPSTLNLSIKVCCLASALGCCVWTLFPYALAGRVSQNIVFQSGSLIVLVREQVGEFGVDLLKCLLLVGVPSGGAGAVVVIEDVSQMWRKESA